MQRALDEALRLETAIRTLRTESKVVVVHHAPSTETLAGEPELI